jgi:hypothetical protein
MMQELTLCDPYDYYSVLGRGLWFEDTLQLIGPNMSKEHAAVLYRAGMRTVRNIWCPEDGSVYEWEEIIGMFPLEPTDRLFWRQLTNKFPRDWSCKLRIGPLPLKKGEWAGLYKEVHTPLPAAVFKVPRSALQIPDCAWFSLPRMMDTAFYSVGAQSNTLHLDETLPTILRLLTNRRPPDDFSVDDAQAPYGFVQRVRVVPILKGKKESKHTVRLFYGPVSELTFDPLQYQWKDGSPLLGYSAKKGRELLRQNVALRDLAATKWRGVLPANHRFNWKQLWNKTRARKESMIIWLIWHQGIAVNAWRHMINAEFREDCCFCLPRIEESILHRFWDCPSARRVWNWATSLMNKLRTRRSHVGPWPAFEMKDVIFTDTLPMQFKKFKLIWPLLKGACVWAMWTQRNEKIFANSTWSDERVLECV